MSTDFFAIDDLFARYADANANGTLTFDKAVPFGFYRLREGEHANKVVIKVGLKCYFANAMTTIQPEKLIGVLCERCYPTFNEPRHLVDFSKSTWYPDGSNTPTHHKW